MIEGYKQFGGIRQDQHRTKLVEGAFQVDQNGNRSVEGCWRRRLGRKRLAVNAFLVPIQTLYGWELAGSGHGLLLVAGTVAEGLLDPPYYVAAGDGDGAIASGSSGTGT